MERFSSDNGKFLDLRRHMSEFEDWIADVPFSTGDVRILCCLEDRRCVEKKVVPSKSACVRNARFQFAELVMHMQDSGIPRSPLYR